MLIDLHTHTYPLSWDASLSPDELVARAREVGLDGVCLTDHDHVWSRDEAATLARRHSFLVLPAAEINTEAGHILVYGLDRYVYGMHRPADLRRHVEAAGGFMVLAHPYRRHMPWYAETEDEALLRATGNPVYQQCHALERINGRATRRENEFAARLCDLTGLPGTAGSDCHTASGVGRCATEFQRRISDLGDLIQELRAGRFRAVDLTAARVE